MTRARTRARQHAAEQTRASRASRRRRQALCPRWTRIVLRAAWICGICGRLRSLSEAHRRYAPTRLGPFSLSRHDHLDLDRRFEPTTHRRWGISPSASEALGGRLGGREIPSNPSPSPLAERATQSSSRASQRLTVGRQAWHILEYQRDYFKCIPSTNAIYTVKYHQCVTV
jgi:hypothetical protein